MQPSVGPDFLQPLQVFMELVVQNTGQGLAVVSILHILLCVQEPVWDLVLACVLHHGDHLFHRILCEPSCLSVRSVSAFLSTTEHAFAPHPSLHDGKGYLPSPVDTRVAYSQMCWNFSGITRHRAAAVGRPPVEEMCISLCVDVCFQFSWADSWEWNCWVI